jgi:hypothetical protein
MRRGSPIHEVGYLSTPYADKPPLSVGIVDYLLSLCLELGVEFRDG